ncbi:MAG: molybdopterin-dependent oxidoreductase [Rhodobacteraceae bacterium]|nr:molybdopterin-dependent oxidoreductase [Paracoccaceae bacterium]
MDKTSSTPATGFVLDGTPVLCEPANGERLSHSLRERLGSRDVKVGCNAGDCGACTVLVDGAPVCACLMPTQQAAGRQVETQAGLVEGDPLAARLAESFQNHQAAQCGICTPGMMVAAVALLRAVPEPTPDQVKGALGGVLCRCTGYRKIIGAVVDVGALTGAPDGSGAVGTSVRRVDGVAKVNGTEAFGDDVAPPGTLSLRIIRSPHAHAAFAMGDVARFVAETPGLTTVLTAADVPGQNRFGVIPGFVDQPVFAETTARFRGEAVAAVVGEADAMAAFDADSFPVTWTPLPAMATPHEALLPDADPLNPDLSDNVMCSGFVLHGDPEAALKNADVVVEGTFTTGFVEHAYIEPEAGYAVPVGDRIEVHACTQAPVMDREALERILGWPASRIRIVPTATGGGFGSKLDVSVQPLLALAALKTGQPVRIAFSRRESMQSTTKRHPSQITARVGATAEGKISGFDLKGDFNTGAYASWGPTVSVRVPVHASGPYRVADYRASARAIHTHCPPAGAFRGFGVPQGAIAQECLFDELAEALGIDPLEFRIRNALRNGDATVCGQIFTQGVGIGACVEALRPAWKAGRADCASFNRSGGHLRRGIGVASGWYGCGNTALANPSTIKSGLRADGTFVLHQGAMDIGQGSNTVIAQIFAQAAGLPLEAVTLVGADTDVTPDGGKTSASRQTYVSGAAALRSGAALRANLLALVNAGPEALIATDDGVLTIRDGEEMHKLSLNRLKTDSDGYVVAACETYDPPTSPMDENGQGHPYAQFGYAAHLATVEVDLDLGTVRALGFTAAHDVGQAINPLLVEGQVHGGIAQGLGMALMEEYLPGRTENLHDYLIPTIGDIPPIETHIIEEPDAHGPYGAKGLGEHVLIPTAPAILNAIHHATGVRIRQVPATPSAVHAALKVAGIV